MFSRKKIILRSLNIMAILVAIITYSLWEFLPKGYFYIGNALFMVLMTANLYYLLKDNLSLFLFCFALNNIIDEITNTNTEFYISEIIFMTFVSVLIIYKCLTKKKT